MVRVNGATGEVEEVGCREMAILDLGLPLVVVARETVPSLNMASPIACAELVLVDQSWASGVERVDDTDDRRRHLRQDLIRIERRGVDQLHAGVDFRLGHDMSGRV